MLKVIVTGGIGSGKSTVVNLFKHYDVPIIDTDVIAHQLTQQAPVLSELQAIFGNTIINQQGQLDRKELRHIVFNDLSMKQKLENVLHPLIHQRVLNELSELEKHQHPYCLIIIPLFAESKQQYPHDQVLVIDASENTQVSRVSQRDGQPAEQIQKIIQSQSSREQRLQLADDVINNDTGKDELPSKVLELHQQYLALATSNQ